MSVTVVGSIAFDAVTHAVRLRASECSAARPRTSRWPRRSSTRFASSVRSATTSATPSSRCCPRAAPTPTTSSASPAARRSSGSGEYGWDLNSRETLDTQLNVFGDFQPKLSAARARVRRAVPREHPARRSSARCASSADGRAFVALDSMNLWIDIARDALVEVIERVDCVILNDAELRQLTGKPNLVSAAREVLGVGPDGRRRQAGRVRRGARHRGRLLRAARLPARERRRPDRRRRHVRRRLRRLPRPARRRRDDGVLRRAMAYGTALASFNVEEFGTERVARLTLDEIRGRVAEIHTVTQFEHEVLAAS